jgi:hypothetical protein
MLLLHNLMTVVILVGGSGGIGLIRFGVVVEWVLFLVCRVRLSVALK